MPKDIDACGPRRQNILDKRFNNSAVRFALVIVRDMRLTGSDAPCIHTMYADKPMCGHSVKQAITLWPRL